MKQKNIPLLIALSIPFVMIGLVALSIGIPRLFFKPSFSVLYVTGSPHWRSNNFSVENGKLVSNEVKVATTTYQDPYDKVKPRFWVYEPKLDMSREIQFEEAQGFRLNSNTKSADGYEIRQGDSVDGLAMALFARSSDWSSLAIEGKGTSRRIKTPITEVNIYTMNFPRFLGWIEN